MTASDRTPLSTARPSGRFVEDDGMEWYRIDGYDLLDPFLVNVVSPSNLWMFVSSSGALTAGRRSARQSLFPYETDDRLHRAAGRRGPVTVIRVGSEIWEPFAAHVPYGLVRRSLAKTVEGDRLRFEEHHQGLGLTFRYTWAPTDRFGFVRACELIAHEAAADVQILDGLSDILPAGVDLATQQTSSTLVDAYRRAEYDSGAGIAVFTLEALVSDRPEPAESLRATLAWVRGLPDPVVALSDRQVRRFRSGDEVRAEHLVKGSKGGLFVMSAPRVEPGEPARWVMAADVEQTHGHLALLRSWLRGSDAPEAEVMLAVDESRHRLHELVEGADAVQVTADRRATAHHFANVLFNVMRGGVFLDEHRVAVDAVARFVASRNRPLVDRFEKASAALGPVVELAELKSSVADDAELARMVAEYLPLSFSRRHGDPSRPWNTFEVTVAGGAGDSGSSYEGNWRDIFQNWDALVHSYPEYIESIIAKFLNASTVDGFNPYRISDRGIDWEMPEEGSWANLGYWGDHQIAYLHRLLDASDRFHPGVLERDLNRVWLSYADVPYRILTYDRIVEDPKSTIVFDDDRQKRIERRVEALGADGRLVTNSAGSGVHLASLAEKLLVPALSKLSNLVAGGGIWMNTQRPEWNDANNALVGNGVSVVTSFYLREYLEFVDRLLERSALEWVPVGQAVVEWIDGLQRVYEQHADVARTERIDPRRRRALLDGLGTVFSEYRELAYASGPGRPKPVDVAILRRLIASVRPFLDQIATRAERSDGLVESYCLVHLEPGSARLEPLYPMLEGQVAALSQGDVSPERMGELVDAMFEGPLYRHDQHTFMLYPDRLLPPYWEKNVVPEAALGGATRALLDADAGVLYRDAEGVVRFDASAASARAVESLLDAVAAELDIGGAERSEILDLYEQVFHHAAFTGRSGTMYRYEGLGSVYWHMVSKLLLAVQELTVRAVDSGAADATVAALAQCYRRVRAGLGYQKDVTEQGTFPTDPHSHTPAHTGAQQPGMTGQVKEGVLLRWGELGVRVVAGCVGFRPVLLERGEFLAEPRVWHRSDGNVDLDAGSLGFTYCGVPVVYHVADGEAWWRVRWSDGRETRGSEQLDWGTSRAILERRGLVDRVDVGVPESWLLE